MKISSKIYAYIFFTLNPLEQGSPISGIWCLMIWGGADIIIIEIKCIINVIHLNHLETTLLAPHPHTWKICFPWNWSLAPKRLGPPTLEDIYWKYLRTFLPNIHLVTFDGFKQFRKANSSFNSYFNSVLSSERRFSLYTIFSSSFMLFSVSTVSSLFLYFCYFQISFEQFLLSGSFSTADIYYLHLKEHRLGKLVFILNIILLESKDTPTGIGENFNCNFK